MRISDWSSDVCSSDLIGRPVTTCDQVPQHGPSARPERAGAILREAFLFLPLRAASRRLCAVARYRLFLHPMLRLRRAASREHLNRGARLSKSVRKGRRQPANVGGSPCVRSRTNYPYEDKSVERRVRKEGDSTLRSWRTPEPK